MASEPTIKRTCGLFDVKKDEAEKIGTDGGYGLGPLIPSLVYDHEDHRWKAKKANSESIGDSLNMQLSSFNIGSSSSVSVRDTESKRRNAQKEYNRQVNINQEVSEYPSTMCCSKCKEPFHYRRNCPKKIGKTEFMVKGSDEKGWNDLWFVSLTRQEHGCGNKSLFIVLNNSFGIEGCPKGYRKEYFRGKGTIAITSSGQEHKIQNVFYVPTLRKNRLSVEKLTQEGFEIEFEGDVCYIKKPIIQKVRRVILCRICESDDHFTFKCPAYDQDNKKEKIESRSIGEVYGRTKSGNFEGFKDKGKRVRFEGDKMEGITNEDKERASIFKHFDDYSINKDQYEGVMERGPVMYPTEGSQLQDCIVFMDMIHITSTVERYKRRFELEFERTVDWFMKEFLQIRIKAPIPPRDEMGYPISLLDLYKTVQVFGGYEKVTRDENWTVVAMSMGYGRGLPSLVSKDDITRNLRQTYVRYLEMLEWYHLKYKGRQLVVEINEEAMEDYKKKEAEWEDSALPPKKRSRSSSSED